MCRRSNKSNQVWTFLTLIIGLMRMSFAQEIEARTYSNAPIGINFLSAGLVQLKGNNYKLTSEVMGFTHILDVAGQSGKLGIVIPYGELSKKATINGYQLNASAQGLSDPVIKASVNLYGAPALTLDQFKSYQQNLIIGLSVAASIPWGTYSDQQMVKIGANRWFIQPGVGASKAIGPWRFELAGEGIFYSKKYQLFRRKYTFSESNLFDSNPCYLLF